MRRIRQRVAAMIVGLALVASVAAPVVTAADKTVTISGFAFPATTTVSIGDTVTWHNTSGATHTATADDASFDTGDIADGASESVTFSTAGSFAYHCSIHSSMTGTIVVQDATAPATDTVASSGAGTDADHDGVAAVLGFLGLVMLIGTLVAQRRFAKR